MSSIDTAYNFYAKHIYDEEKIYLLKKHNLKVAGSVQSVLWELFAALLVERPGTGATGADLDGWEVKSAKQGGSFEYQYHLNSGADKLKEDCIANHLFCTYSDTYENVTVRTIQGSLLANDFFKRWEPDYIKNYDKAAPASLRRQRFRKSIPFGLVDQIGIVVLEIEQGKLKYKNENIILDLNTH